MTHYYVFNGDADGLCALQQLRLAASPSSDPVLVTGVKRDIALLDRVPGGPDDECTVLDVSLDVNRAALVRLLKAGTRVLYFDHHFAGEVPSHPMLEAHVDTSARVCTSLLVDRYLAGSFRSWAVAGVFGDSLNDEGRALAHEAGLSNENAERLKELGVAVNYNAYGETVADLHVPPAVLAEEMRRYADPLAFRQRSETFARLANGFRSDMELARRLEPRTTTAHSVLYVLPDAAWARRASGTFANDVAKAFAGRAIAIVSPKTGGGYLVSVRVPEGTGVSADAFCRTFPTGGGRKTAAGINHLPGEELESFAAAFEEAFENSASRRSPS
jgi:hypothetical protein